MQSLTPDSNSYDPNKFKLPDAKEGTGTAETSEVEGISDEMSMEDEDDSAKMTALATKLDTIASEALETPANKKEQAAEAQPQSSPERITFFRTSGTLDVVDKTKKTPVNENEKRLQEETKIAKSVDESIDKTENSISEKKSEMLEKLSTHESVRESAVSEKNIEGTRIVSNLNLKNDKTQSAQQEQVYQTAKATAIADHRGAINTGKMYLPQVIDGKVVLEKVTNAQIENLEQNVRNLIFADGDQVRLNPEFAKKFPGLTQFSFRNPDGTISQPKEMKVSTFTEEEMEHLEQAVKDHVADFRASQTETSEVKKESDENKELDTAHPKHHFEFFTADKYPKEWKDCVSVFLSILNNIEEFTIELNEKKRSELAEQKKEFFKEQDLKKEMIKDEKAQEDLVAEGIDQEKDKEELDAATVQNNQIKAGIEKNMLKGSVTDSLADIRTQPKHTYQLLALNRASIAA